MFTSTCFRRSGLWALPLIVTACTSNEAPTEAATEQDMTGVPDAHAERLFAALKAAGVSEEAEPFGLVGVVGRKVLCVTANNGPVAGPMHLVPITTCNLDVGESASPPHIEITDAAQRAGVLFGAIADADGAFVHVSQEKLVASVQKVSCDGTNQDEVSTCQLFFGDEVPPVTIDGAKSARLVQGFALAEAVTHSTGHHHVRATNIRCERLLNNTDPNSPQYKIESTHCTFDADEGFNPRQRDIADPEPKALGLQKALEAAGVRPTGAAGGQTGVSVDSVRCSKRPGAKAYCGFAGG